VSGITFPQGSSQSIAYRSRAEEAPDIRKTSLDQEGLSARRDAAPGAFSLTWLLLLLFVGLGIVGVLIIIFRGIGSIPPWP